jgi:hypothetical protein
MKFFRQGRWITTGALLVAALCTPLLAAERTPYTPAHQVAATQADCAIDVSAPQPRDALVARSSSATLSLHQNHRRADHFAAALASPVASTLSTVKPPRAAGLPVLRIHTSLLPAASRAPPSLVA